MKKLWLFLFIFFINLSVANALVITIDYTQRQLSILASAPSDISNDSISSTSFDNISSDFSDNFNVNAHYSIPADDEMGQDLGAYDNYVATAYANQISSVLNSGSELSGEFNSYIFGQGGFQKWYDMAGEYIDNTSSQTDWHGYSDFVLQFTIDEAAEFYIDSIFTGSDELTSSSRARTSLYSATSPYDEIFNVTSDQEESFLLEAGSYSFSTELWLQDNYLDIEENMRLNTLFTITAAATSIPEPATMYLLGIGMMIIFTKGKAKWVW